MAPAPRIGFIGQGWIGKHYADDFEARGYDVVRYGLEPAYVGNKEKIASCDIVFVAVPTPTTSSGFDHSRINSVLPLVGKGKIAVIKSTLVPGTTEKLQDAFPHIIILSSPEFLVESTAAHDAAHPDRNIIGIPKDTPEHRAAAEQVLAVLPKAPFSIVCSSKEAELIKYLHNVHGYFQIIFSNLSYDLASKIGAGWEPIKQACLADPMMSHRYLDPVHKKGRGAGGDCFIKDFAAFRDFYEKQVGDKAGTDVLKSIEQKNIRLLVETKKDLGLLRGVYGEDVEHIS